MYFYIFQNFVFLHFDLPEKESPLADDGLAVGFVGPVWWVAVIKMI